MLCIKCDSCYLYSKLKIYLSPTIFNAPTQQKSARNDTTERASGTSALPEKVSTTERIAIKRNNNTFSLDAATRKRIDHINLPANTNPASCLALLFLVSNHIHSPDLLNGSDETAYPNKTRNPSPQTHPRIRYVNCIPNPDRDIEKE